MAKASDLSFVLDRPRKGRCFWNVKPSGRYDADCRLGERLALEYLAYEEADVGGPGLLPSIVCDMPRELTGVEIAFLQLVALQARAGRGRAQQIVGHWSGLQAA